MTAKQKVSLLNLLWAKFKVIPIDNNDRIIENFCHWKKGTDRFEIWHWFDEHYPEGVVKNLQKGVE